MTAAQINRAGQVDKTCPAQAILWPFSAAFRSGAAGCEARSCRDEPASRRGTERRRKSGLSRSSRFSPLSRQPKRMAKKNSRKAAIFLIAPQQENFLS